MSNATTAQGDSGTGWGWVQSSTFLLYLCIDDTFFMNYSIPTANAMGATTMKLESLTIAPAKTYISVGPGNLYTAKLAISYNENTMQVTLSPEVCERIMRLAGDEIARAAAKVAREVELHRRTLPGLAIDGDVAA